MQTKSLYERLGGYDAIAAVTDDLLARLLNDPQLGVFWKGHSENSLRRDRQLVVNYMYEAAGGPVFYTGRDMQTSHKGLGLVSVTGQSLYSMPQPRWKNSRCRQQSAMKCWPSSPASGETLLNTSK